MIVLFGAGNCGRSIARNLKEPFVFVDNDSAKIGMEMMGVPVLSPEIALSMHPDDTWVVSIGKPERKEVSAQLENMGVKLEMPWKYLDMKMGLPSVETGGFVVQLAGDVHTVKEFTDQFSFRTHPDYDKQIPCDDMLDIYFPDFIVKRDDEHFVDCGAADGDTIAEFCKRWDKWSFITGFEPDRANYGKLRESVPDHQWIDLRWGAVSDSRGMMPFQATGDYSAHLAPHISQPATTLVNCTTLDDSLRYPPTFIKMDIEGSELEALWGARRILKDHSPVLAICAYHKSEDLWQIPMLIHALQPDYKLFLRRYSPGTMDLVWYAVPFSRMK